jgi:ABC-type transport system involved in Fe-S cluster assembly, ATPase component
MLELKNISFKRDDKVILDNITLKIDTETFIAITGPNGSGKSTLAKIIMGIEKPDTGSIFLDGIDITKLDINKRAELGIAFAFQQPVKFKGITVYDILKLASQKELSKKEACEVLGSVGMCAEAYLNRDLNSSLSGGELKRIEIATVVLRNSKLTIFDEPEAGIDLWSFNSLIKVFSEIRKQVSGATIVITHQERILNIADKIVLLKDGKVDYYGNKDEIIDKLYSSNPCPNMEGSCEYGCN